MRRILLAVLTMCSLGSLAQDLHFTQYFNAPLLVNPANTGFNPEADYRVGGNYRNQWAALQPGVPYKTMSVWGDVQLFNNRFENAWVGVGGALMKDVAGTGSLAATKGYASVAYHQMVGWNSLVSLGFNAGFVQKSIDFSKLTFLSQWNGKFFDAVVPAGELSFMNNRQSYFDLQVGMNFATFPSDNSYINLGLSALHVNRPKERFFSNTDASSAIVAPRFTMFLNGVFKLNDRWILSPNAYISRMGNAMEYVAGGIANYNLSGDGTTQLLGGLYYRVGDAVAPTIGFQLNSYKLTFNYDATMSGLSSYNATRGAMEVSLVKTGVFSEGKAVKCNVPSF